MYYYILTTVSKTICIMNHNAKAGKERYLHYYSKVHSIITDAEIEKFIDTIEKPLPITFWICHSNNAENILDEIRNCLKHGFSDSLQLLAWQNKFMACSIDIPRELLRKSQELSKLKDLLIKYSEVGFIWRQEEVSMIPPLFLNIQKGDKILDMCAAPGSKTAQLLFLLGKENYIKCSSQTQYHGSSYSYEAGAGYVVANDSNCKRLDMLIHRVKTLERLFPYAIFTNHDARFFPPYDHGCKTQRFNKILCDVPCSGDGTVRKSNVILREWRESNAYTLHPIQLDIALKAAALLEIHGLMVYSTCSMNPVENEAVVHSLMKICDGSMEIVDPCEYSFVSYDDEKGKFKVRPGMTHWSVDSSLAEKMSKGKTNLRTPHCAYAISDSCSPPGNEADKQWLKKTMRILPHDQNTGGFFIAVLKKKKPLSWEAEGVFSAGSNTQTVSRTSMDGHQDSHYVSVPQELVSDISKFYSLGNVVPIFHGHLISHRKLQSEEATTEVVEKTALSKTIGFVSKSVYEILIKQEATWNIVNAGLRIFSVDRPRKDVEIFPWRVCNEGVQLLLEVLGHRSIEYGECLSSTCSTDVSSQGFFSSSTGDLSSRIVPLPLPVVIELLLSPKKSLSIECFAEVLGEGCAHKLSELAPGGLIFSVLARASLFPGFSGLLTKYSIQATISDREMPTYIHAFQKLDGSCSDGGLNTIQCNTKTE